MKTQILFARMRENHNPGFFPFTLEAGQLYPIDITQSILRGPDDFNVLKRDIIGMCVAPVPRAKCTCVFKVVESKFNEGQIVIKKGCRIPFRISSIKWDRADFWYQDIWGDSQNLSSGAYESDLMLASDDEIEAHADVIRYHDELNDKRSMFIQTITIESKMNES